MASKAGGGINSKNVVRKGQRLGQRQERVHVPQTNRMGAKYGDHVTEAKGGDTNYRGETPLFREKYGNVPLGNEVAATTDCKAGGSRTVMKPGQQGSH
jgi:hypothetical protein